MKLSKITNLLFCLFALTLFSFKKAPQHSSLSLNGQWELCLDSINSPVANLNFNLTTTLPGTLDEAGIGKPDHRSPQMVREVMLHLQRKNEYIGKAWYRKNIEIPKSFSHQQAILKLERVIWKSVVTIDGKQVGSCNSLTVPHYYNLTGYLSPGKHQLMICIDNSKQFDLNNANMAHAYTNETQIMWNGILGDFKIDFYPSREIANMQVYPNGKNVTAKIEGSFDAKAQIQLTVKKAADHQLVAQKVFKPSEKGIYSLDIEKDITPWSEFSPQLYELEATVMEKGKVVQSLTTDFGFRSLIARGNSLEMNGRPLFLRGTLECCIFPLTGHPPVEVSEWLKVFKKAKAYGLNHLRFHSWCPPEAAFKAADRMGFYLQVELPNWNTHFGEDGPSAEFIEAEASRIISEYGNHPSFCFLSMGNELQGDFARMTSLVKKLKGMDNRHLYTTTTFTFEPGHGKFPEPVDDYFITQYTDSGWVRGQGVFDTEYPNFRTDYTKAVKHLPIPLITHEIGQYSVYPNLEEINKYTGVLRPLNFESIKADLEKKGLLSLAPSYLAASGKLAALLYKEEIERALKTNGISGFQLLDLHDFPGQGTALVGLLDAFWDSKGIIDSLEFKKFCSPVVPLIWMDKAVYKNSEHLVVETGIANYAKALKNQNLKLEILNNQQQVLQQRTFKAEEIQQGKTSKLGQFNFDLTDIKNAQQLTIRLSVEGTTYENNWSVWIYPTVITESVVSDIVITRSFEEAQTALAAGKKVLLNPDLKELNGLQGKFVQVFWSPVHFPDQPGTMGLLMDPSHAVFKSFPTEFHSNWQWWDLCKQSKTLDISGMKVTPLVRVVDNFYKNRSLANLFEVKVGMGKLIFSSMDLSSNLDKRAEAAQLRQSVLNYMN
ncbi:MAG: sugar-binding domain-containing protein, partial [Candidatus Saccharibacteria bacterium]